MKHILIFCALLFASVVSHRAVAQSLSLSSLEYKSNDTIGLNAVCHFTFDPGCPCPPLLGWDMTDSPDTLHVKLYYHSGICVLGSCTTVQYMDLGVVPPHTKDAVKLYPVEVYQVNPPVWDTTIRPESIRVIPLHWPNNVTQTGQPQTRLRIYPSPASGQTTMTFPYSTLTRTGNSLRRYFKDMFIGNNHPLS